MIKVFESFAGIGTQRMALKNQGIEHELTAISEVDEYALLSYHAIHTADIEVEEASEKEMQRYMEEKNIPLDPKGKRKILKNKRLKDLYVASVASNNLGDISKITDDEIPKVDLFTYSFPCQDISLAGKQKGLDKNSGTRSSLLWECEKIIETVKPKYLLMENVKALVNKNNKPQFDIWLEYLEELGYKNFWKILNGKDYGIPQNRERVFVVSTLDENADYKFPAKIPLILKLKDILEDNVDDSYYLSQEQVDRITFSTYNIAKTRIQEIDYSDTLCARDYKGPKVVRVGNVNPSGNGMNGNVYNENGVAPTVTTNKGEGSKVLVNQYNGFQNKETPSVKVKQIGQYNTPTRQNSNRYRVYDKEAISPTLTSASGGNIDPHILDDDVVVEPIIVASRGRNPNNPSDRTVGSPTEQRLEPNSQGLCNTLTSVQKDNLVLEPAILTPKRTEYGKSIRKDYESGKIQESRHNMTELQPRKDGISNTLTTVQKNNLLLEQTICEQRTDEGLRFFRDNICGTIRTTDAGGDKRIVEKQDIPKNDLVKIKNATKKGYIEACDGDGVDLEYPDSNTRRGRVQNGMSQTLDTGDNKGVINQFKIRKLTPNECWRLMGIADENFEKASKVVSNSQLYKQAGNAIVVDVLEGIFKQLFNPDENNLERQ